MFYYTFFLIKYFIYIYNYNKYMFEGINLKLYRIHGTSTIILIIRGNKTVQQNNINWSNLILGNEALTQIKINIIKLDFRPNVIPYIFSSNNRVLFNK